MRDPKRMAAILSELGQYWMKYPDLRLAQIVSNMNSMHRTANSLPPDNDPYYLEDEDLLRTLERANVDSKNVQGS